MTTENHGQPSIATVNPQQQLSTGTNGKLPDGCIFSNGQIYMHVF
jgi:hypothetical protein